MATSINGGVAMAMWYGRVKQGRWWGMMEWSFDGKNPLSASKLSGHGVWQKCGGGATLYFGALAFGIF